MEFSVSLQFYLKYHKRNTRLWNVQHLPLQTKIKIIFKKLLTKFKL